MKTKRKISTSDPVSGFLKEHLGSKANSAILKLKSYRIETVGQLAGIMQISITRLTKKEAQRRGVSAGYLLTQNNRLPDAPIQRLKRLLQISESEAKKLANVCEMVPEDYQRYYFDTGWALGAVKRSVKSTQALTRDVSRNKIFSGFYVIPRIEEAGQVFNQGERGTCVANATCTLLNYKSGRNLSRQFHYHQCKMVDRMIHIEGTTIESAFKILSKKSLIDIGIIDESIWKYVPHSKRTEHQGPPPEDAFFTERVLTANQPVFISKNDKVQDIKYLLNYEVNGKTCPVVIGIPLYESFFSWSTAETGWVTLPIPGEAVVGHHAMIVVGYDEDRKLFLVRNSWGPHWATQNDKGYNGHAWIPYNYISRFCETGASIIDVDLEEMVIQEHDRLYFRKLRSSRKQKTIASSRTKTKSPQRKRRRISFSGWLIRAAAILLLWHAYQEPINNFKNKLLTYLEGNVDLSTIRNITSEKIEKLTN